MNMLRRSVAGLGLAACVIALSQPAAADGYYRRGAGLSACCYNWTGFYIGSNSGIASGDLSSSLSVTNGALPYFAVGAIPGLNASGSQNLDSHGYTSGVQAGYNVQSGGLVWGIEVDINSLRLKESAGGVFNYTTNGAPYILTQEASTSWMLTLRPRVGVAMDRSMFYVTGGLAVTRLHFNQFFAEPPFTPTPETASVSKTNVGWTLGGGYEAAISHNWTFKAEYLFARFDVDDAVGGLSVTAPAPAAVAVVLQTRSATFLNRLDDLDVHILRMGFNYKFGECCGGRPLK